MSLRLILTLVAVHLAAPTLAAPVPFTYTINTTGKGPGLESVVRVAKAETVAVGGCEDCNAACVLVPAVPGLAITDLFVGPAGQPNLNFQVSTGGATYKQTGGWGWSSNLCQGVNGGGGPEFGGDVRIPTSCFNFGVGVTTTFEPNQYCVCVRDPAENCVFGCPTIIQGARCAPMDTMTLTVTYKRQSATAPKTCTQSGAKSVEPDGEWHHVATANCMTAPDIAMAWTGNVSGVAAGALAESRMVANIANPDSGNGPHMIVRAVTLQQCPPNCPPPDACVVCLQTPGKTLVQCQADGACPAGCPPFCPPPPGCPPTCPPPPKCPPYCPPPPGCPEDPSQCPQGCPPICPPPAGCPEDPSKCPEPPGCPPNCPPPGACMACINSGKTQGQCEASGDCPAGCPPQCPTPVECQ